jgi:EAL domain-containing protein (putative c-di-GMP-specific phosphodiesterase class I)
MMKAWGGGDDCRSELHRVRQLQRSGTVLLAAGVATHLLPVVRRGRRGSAAAAVLGAASVPLILLADRRYQRLCAALTSESDELASRRDVDRVAERASADKRERVRAVLAAGDSLTMAYQPVLDLDEGVVVGVEALARFADGRAPTAWFAEAHEVGLGPELELLAITLALNEVPATGHLSLNVSPAALGRADLLIRLCEASDAPERLVLEITEHAVVEDYDLLVRRLEPLRRLGVRIAVDDAGSGFASLRHILAVHPDVVKLDRTLVSSIHLDPARRALATSLIGFASSIGADLVAEGVELADELAACRQLGIRFGQGFLLGRPEPRAPAGSRSD